MTVSEAMIAISAELATLWPKVGPIDSVVGSSAKPNSCSQRLLRRLDAVRARARGDLDDVLAQLRVVDRLDLGVGQAGALRARCAPASTLAAFSSGAVIRVPPSKSMPKLRPLPAIANAPISMITPEAEKNHFEAPM